MGLFKDREGFEQVMRGLIERILQHEQMVKDLTAANMVLRFRYREPEAVVTIDLTKSPPSFRFDDQGQAHVEMVQSADVSHEFWLGRLSVVRAMGTGKIMARGNPAKAMKLLPAIRPAFDIYPEVLRELGLEHLIPEKETRTARRKQGQWFRRLRFSRKVIDPTHLPKDTWFATAGEEELLPIEFREFPLPEDETGRSLELLRRMYLVREFEEALAREWAQGKIPTTAIHLSTGQEASSVGVCAALRGSDCIATTHRGHGHMLAKGAGPDKMMAEIYGKAEGLCKGKGGTMHVTDAEVGAIGANGIVGASALLATGAALAFDCRKEDRVAVAFFGDGAANQGMVHEAMNLAAVWNLPVLFVVENNLYGEFTPQKDHMRLERIAARAAAYGMPGETVDGNDVEAVYGAAREAVDNLRAGKGPTLLECLTYRWHGHMQGDDQGYRTPQEVEEWKGRCPIKGQVERLVSRNILTREKADLMEGEAREVISKAVRFAESGSEPDPSALGTDVYVTEPIPPTAMASGKAMNTITGSTAINLALTEEMGRDNSVILMGEDVALGGYMAVTNGLVEEFGSERVKDTPISEYAITGAAVGAAMSGLRPVAELLFSDFITCAMDPIVNQAAKLRYMSGGQYRMPLVVRTPGGTGLGMAAQHSQSLEALLMGIPGLIIAAPSTPRDCRALLKTAIRSDNPVLFFEHKLLYLAEGKVPVEEELIPFGKADIKRAGSDVTVVALLYTVNQSLEAAEYLAAEGIETEVIDLRTLSPLDTDTILQSAAKTGRLITVEEGVTRGGWGAEVVARLATAAHGLLKAPPLRMGASDNPIPFNRSLENLSVPDAERIAAVIRKVMG